MCYDNKGQKAIRHSEQQTEGAVGTVNASYKLYNKTVSFALITAERDCLFGGTVWMNQQASLNEPRAASFERVSGGKRVGLGGVA